MKFKIMIFLLFDMGLSYGLELNLQSLPEFGDIKVSLEENTGDLFFMKISGSKDFDEILIVKKKPGQFGNYTFEPHLFDGFRLYKTSKKTKFKGSDKEIFELHLAGIKDPIRMIALKASNNALKSQFDREEYQGQQSLKILQGKIKDSCDKEIPLGGKLDNRAFKIVRGIMDLCLKDEDYKEGLQALNKITYEKSDGENPIFKIQDNMLTIKSGKGMYNSRYAIKYWLENNL